MDLRSYRSFLQWFSPKFLESWQTGDRTPEPLLTARPAPGGSGTEGAAGAGCSRALVAHTRSRRKRCLRPRSLCLSTQPSASLPWDYLLDPVPACAGWENKGLHSSDRCAAPCCATALRLGTRSYWGRSSGAITAHLAHTGETRLHFLLSVKHLEHGQLLT